MQLLDRLAKIIRENGDAEAISIFVTTHKGEKPKIDYHVYGAISKIDDDENGFWDFARYETVRDLAGMNDHQVAMKAGISQARITEWKQGHQPLYSVGNQIATALGCDVCELQRETSQKGAEGEI